MSNKKIIHVAVVDSCEFIVTGLRHLMNHELNAQGYIFFHGFTDINELTLSMRLFDIIIYDPLNPFHFRLTTNEDILRIKNKQPKSLIYIYSLSVGYLSFKNIDGAFNKRMPLDDIKALWKNLMNHKTKGPGRYNTSIVTCLRIPVKLSSEEASVLRGYSYNLKTKQIAFQLGCNQKLIYIYKKNAMKKLMAVRGPSFYHRIRWILN